MHPNPIYRPEQQSEAIAIAREAGFGMLAVSAPNAAPMLSHVPFLLSASGTLAELHLVRSNPIARSATAPVPARIAVQRPHGYVSPDWYELDDQVPTWNYLAIHLTGTLSPMPDDTLPDLLARQSAHFEAPRRPNRNGAWTSSPLTPPQR
ncbi:FMN-binding negative transcriptional regulator [Phycobium rhodophyticola]